MKLDVFQKAYWLSIEVHRRSQGFPKFEVFELGKQLRRAATSVCANIVEGLTRNPSPKEKCRYLDIAMGSNDETRFWLMYAVDLGYLEPREYEGLEKRYEEVGKMLYGVKRSIQKT